MNNIAPNKIEPLSQSKGIISDIRIYLFHKPEVKTLIRFNNDDEREDYSARIIQRLGVSVSKYSILNIHRISVDVPVKYVFEELLNWNGDSTTWPNNIARVYRINDKIDNINIYPLGKKWFPFGLSPLFSLHSLRIQDEPDTFAFDNARYLLYNCTGGYPIGIFSMYVRSSIPNREEPKKTQLFFIVGFNFYGKKSFSMINVVNRLWEAVHNRVTSNTMIRFKQLCEWKFDNIQNNI